MESTLDEYPAEPPGDIAPNIYARLRQIPYVTVRMTCGQRAILIDAFERWLESSNYRSFLPVHYPEELTKELLDTLRSLPGPYPVTMTMSKVEAHMFSWAAMPRRQDLSGGLGGDLGEWLDGTTTMPVNRRGSDWDTQRQKALERAGWVCEWCGRTNEEELDDIGRGLHVHHRVHFREFGKPADANKLDNLLAVCSKCHKTVENNTDPQRRLAQYRD